MMFVRLKWYVAVVVFAVGLAGNLEAAINVNNEPVPTANYSHDSGGVVALDGKVYAFGGHPGYTTPHEMYDPTTNVWTTLAPLPDGRSGMGEFVLDGKIYCVGGERDGWNPRFMDNVWRYDPITNSWSTMNNYPVAAWDPLSVVCNGKAYVFGGRRTYDATYADTYEYNEIGDSWTKKADMLLSVMQAGTVSYGGKIYVFGGNHKINEPTNQPVNKVQIYDPATDTWQYGTDMPIALTQINAVIIGNDAFLFGGYIYDSGTGIYTPNEAIYKYSFTTGTWTTYPFVAPITTSGSTAIPVVNGYAYFFGDTAGTTVYDHVYRVLLAPALIDVPTAGYSHANGGVVALDDKIYAFGGNPSYTTPHEMYDPATNVWTTLAPLPVGRAGVGEFMLDGMIYCVGGEGPSAGWFNNTVYRYDPIANAWSTLNNFPVDAWDPLTIVCNGKAYVFGGRRTYGATYADTYEYNAGADSWTKKADMLISVMDNGCVSYGGKIYVFGGNHKVNEPTSQPVNKVQIYDPTSDTWQYGTDMPIAMYMHKAVIIGSDAFLFDGYIYDSGTGTSTSSDAIYQYSFKTGIWTIYPFVTPVSTSPHNAIPVVNGYAYFFGDSTTTGVYDDVYGVLIPYIYCTGSVVGDLNDDCIVDFCDFAIMASHWLDCNRRNLIGECIL